MKTARRWTLAVAATVCGLPVHGALGQEPKIVTRDGVQYQETRRVVQRVVPTTVMQDRQQTVYTQQVTTSNINHQQLYCVPTTSYRWDSRLRGRWNPFVTPYWTHHLKPVTTWSTQVANVQIPVNQVAWVPQTTTVQVPVTAYRNAEEEIVTRVPLNTSTALASAQPLGSSGPTATLAARPGTTSASRPLGGQALQKDPPRQASGWQSPGNASGYR